jgi:hypothetical protein
MDFNKDLIPRQVKRLLFVWLTDWQIEHIIDTRRKKKQGDPRM